MDFGSEGALYAKEAPASPSCAIRVKSQDSGLKPTWGFSLRVELDSILSFESRSFVFPFNDIQELGSKDVYIAPGNHRKVAKSMKKRGSNQ